MNDIPVNKTSAASPRLPGMLLAILALVGGAAARPQETKAGPQVFEWPVVLEAGTRIPSTVSVLNRCHRTHRFRLVPEGLDFLELPEGTELKIRASSQKTAEVVFDTSGMSPGTYSGDLVIQCLTCAKEPTCRQDRDLVHITLTLTEGQAGDTTPGGNKAGGNKAGGNTAGGDTAGGDTTPDTMASSADSDCEDARIRLEAARRPLVAAADRLRPALEAALPAAAEHAAAVRRAGEARAEAEAAEHQTRQAREELAEHDRRRRELEGVYDRGLEAAEGEADAQALQRLRQGRERMGRRYDRDRAPLADRVRDLEDREAAAERDLAQAEQARAGALGGARDAEAELVAALAAFRAAKEAFADVAVLLHRCFPCELFQSLAGELDAYRGRLSELFDRLDRDLARALEEAELARTEADARREDLAVHDRESEDDRRALEAMEDRMRSILPRGQGFGPEPGDGPDSIGVLPGSDLRLHFDGDHLAIVSRFLQSDTFQDLRRNYRQERRELAGRAAARPEIARQARRATAREDAARRRIEHLEELHRRLGEADLEANLRVVLDRLTEARGDCLAELRECLERIQLARRLLRNRLAELRRKVFALRSERDRLERLRRDLAAARAEVGPVGSEALDAELAALQRRLDEARGELEASLRQLADEPRAPGGDPAETAAECRRRVEELRDRIDAVDAAGRAADEAGGRSRNAGEAIADDLAQVRVAADRIRRYREAVERHRRCVKEKREALRRLREIYAEGSGGTAEYLEGLDGLLSDLDSQLGDLEDLTAVGSRVEALGQLSKELGERLGRLREAISVLEDLTQLGDLLEKAFRAQTLSPAESAEALSQFFQLAAGVVPEIPGVSEFLSFYGDALEAIAEAIGKIQRQLVRTWIESDLSLDTILDVAPVGLRDEIRRAYEIRDLLAILRHDCGPVPTLDTEGS